MSRFSFEALKSLGLPEDVITAWQHDPACPADDSQLTGPLWWLDDNRRQEVLANLQFASSVQDAFTQCAAELRQTGDQLKAWQTFIQLAAIAYIQPDRGLRQKAINRPGPAHEAWGLLADMYKPMVYLTALPGMIACHEQLGIDSRVTRDTADDLPLWMEQHHRLHGRWGTDDQSGWFCNHLAGELFTLGRLQHELARFQFPYTIWQHEQGKHVAMVQAGQRLRADGQFADADHDLHASAPDNWTSQITETPEAITGHLVDPAGFVRAEPETLRKTAWRKIVQAGDPVLSVHIPARGRLDTKACEDSFQQATTFFSHYFPHHQVKAFICSSWLMDPQLTLLEQGQSNVGRFVQLFQSLPIPRSNGDQLFERVFNNQKDLPTLPRDTTMRRALIAQMEAGRQFRSAGGYRLPQRESL